MTRDQKRRLRARLRRERQYTGLCMSHIRFMLDLITDFVPDFFSLDYSRSSLFGIADAFAHGGTISGRWPARGMIGETGPEVVMPRVSYIGDEHVGFPLPKSEKREVTGNEITIMIGDEI